MLNVESKSRLDEAGHKDLSDDMKLAHLLHYHLLGQICVLELHGRDGDRLVLPEIEAA